MKKSFRSIALVTLAALIAVMFTSCTKTPSDAESFKKLAESKNYEVYDASSQYSDSVEITECIIAFPSGHDFQIEFYTITDKDNAKKLYQAQSDIMEGVKGSSYSGGVSNGSNYAKRTLTTDGKYLMVTYIENTLIYVPPTDQKYKDEINSFIKDFKY